MNKKIILRQRIATTPLNLALAATLLSSTHVIAEETNNAERTEAKTLQAVKVQAEADGAEEEGYKSGVISRLGIWEGRSLQDTPYSVTVVPGELIKNIQAVSADQIFKINPVTQFHWPQTQNDNPYVFLRGFQTTTFARDGIVRQKWNYAHGTTMEEIERVEVLTGLSGFLYGAGNLGGVVNFITKKPTMERMNSVTLGNTGGQNFYAHGDFGGQFDENAILGYRVNVVAQNGETAIDDQHNKRFFISGAFDWQVTDNLLLAIDVSRRDYHLKGRQAYWYLGSGVIRPDADRLDTSKLWAQPWAMQDMETERLGASLRWTPLEWLGVRAGYLDESNSRTGTTASNTIQADGTMNQEMYTNRDAPQTIMGSGSYGFVDIKFSTGPLKHKLTAGYQISKSLWDLYPDANTFVEFAGLPLDRPTYFSEPQWGAHGRQPVYQGYDQRTRAISLGDDIRFGRYWSLLLGATESKVFYDHYDPSQLKAEPYEKSKITPTLSLIYKPRNTVSAYLSYIEGLEQGGVAAEFFQETIAVVNAGEFMKPLVSDQLEAGLKIFLGEMLLTTAVFEIDKPLEYYHLLNESNAELVQDGRQVHRGLEFTATGKLSEHLTLFAGMTWLDAKVRENEQTPAIEGKRPQAVAEKMLKAYLEYQIPALPDLTLNAGFNYTGDFYGNAANSDHVPGYTLMDIGARYLMEVADRPLTLRLNIQNLSDERYWANQYFLGDPRTILLSTTFDF